MLDVLRAQVRVMAEVSLMKGSFSTGTVQKCRPDKGNSAEQPFHRRGHQTVVGGNSASEVTDAATLIGASLGPGTDDILTDKKAGKGTAISRLPLGNYLLSRVGSVVL